MNLNKNSFLFILSYCLFAYCLNAQNDAAYLLLDGKIGIENTMLFNGVQNIDPDVTVNEKNKFLYNTEDFNIASITYDHQYYPSVQVKFNVVDDLILVKIPVQDKFSTFRLISSRIQEFTLKNKKFENLSLQSHDEYEGFYEKLFEDSELTLFKKYNKDYTKKMERNYAYFEFEPADSNYVFEHKGEFYPANSRKDLFSVLPSQKSTIKKFFRENKAFLKSQPDDFRIQLFKEISSHIDTSE